MERLQALHDELAHITQLRDETNSEALTAHSSEIITLQTELQQVKRDLDCLKMIRLP